MKYLITVALFSFSMTAYAGDFSEIDGPLMDRIIAGCEKYAEKQKTEALANHFNMNGWAGGSVSAGSYSSAEESAKGYKSFMMAQCQNMVAEVLELKLGYAPWQ